MDEHAWARAVAILTGGPQGALVGVGDDAAVLRAYPAPTVLSVDAMVEGTHFRREWLELADLGARACVTALSDLAAMRAAPVAALLSLVVPRSLGERSLEIVRGAAKAASVYGARVVGGNLSAGPSIVVSTTAVGALPGRALRRSGARPLDHVYVTGPVGAAAIGWRALAAERETEALAPFIERWRRPPARFDAARLLDHATAAIDLSDGLADDLRRVCVSSGVRAELEPARLPLWPGAEEAAASLGEDARALALSGGEDYELLFTAPPSAASVLGQEATRVGRVFSADGVDDDPDVDPVTLVDDEGRALPAPTGFRHLS